MDYTQPTNGLHNFLLNDQQMYMRNQFSKVFLLSNEHFEGFLCFERSIEIENLVLILQIRSSVARWIFFSLHGNIKRKINALKLDFTIKRSEKYFSYACKRALISDP